MRRLSPLFLTTLIAIAALTVIACDPASPAGQAQPTPTTGPDFNGTALAEASSEMATALAEEGFVATPVSSGAPVDASVASPITATFFPERQATEYTITLGSPVDPGSWIQPSCGDFTVEPDGYKMTWGHAHPPCDETTGHDDETVLVYLRIPTPNGIEDAVCKYQGAHSGIGEPCEWY